MAGKRILVTGGAGFIGSHLCKKLIGLGQEVLCLDNFFTGFKDNIAELLGHPRFELIRHDVIMPIWLKVDKIYNLACPASPVHYQHNPVKTLQTSIFGAMHVLQLAAETGAKVLHASTSEVYGDPLAHPQPETYWGNVNPIGRRSCYDEGKRCAETLCVDYGRQYGLNVKVVRIFNTYGPNMHPKDGRVVSNFITQALNGEEITVYGSGQQTRAFCYVDDMIDGLLRMMAAESCVTGPVNLGNPGEFTILELAEKILRLTDSRSKLVFKPLPVDDPKQRRPDIALARRILDWEPKVGLDDGLQSTIAYFKNRLAAGM